MTTAERFTKLASLCKCSINIGVNNHRDSNDAASVHLDYYAASHNNGKPLASPDVIEGMIERDTIINVQCYPQTPIGFVSVYHYDLDAALDAAIVKVENYGK